ncbi:MAG: inositol monophosphatase [Planctomycetales bacterium]|nr:inositol monophosphatase [Planctomycetales bacterium]
MPTPEMRVAREAAAAAGDVLMRYFRDGFAIRTKSANNLVTDADIEAEQTVAQAIRAAFPDHALLGEEGLAGDVSAEHLWVIDPLDGTNNFAHRIPHFAVSIAYYHRGQPMCGAIYNPARGDWFTAARGHGAWAGDRPARVGAEKALNESLVACGFYYDRGAMMESTLSAIRDAFAANVHGVRRMGTASLDLAQVGCGLFGAYFEYLLSPWDFAAGRLFVEEAGGRVTTARGEDVPIASCSIMASNGLLHDEMLAITARHHL